MIDELLRQFQQIEISEGILKKYLGFFFQLNKFNLN